MEFEKRKAAMLASLGSSETDKSPKGSLDAPIIPLLNTLNSHPSYFTTSSCSGRISILSHPKPSSIPTSSAKKKARGGSWLFITHDPADPHSVLPLLFPPHSDPPTDSNDFIFRFEPLIIAVECKDVDSAQFLVSLAISSGFRESGITSANKKRVIVGIRCSIRMEVPLGDSHRLLVSPQYVRFLVDVANEKMEANKKRTQGFLTALKEHGFVEEPAISENRDHACDDAQDKVAVQFDTTVGDANIGPVEPRGCSLFITPIAIVGEPVEKLFLWGHSACSLDHTNDSNILVFGGFGGMGRHARRNDTLLLNISSGTLKTIDMEGAPSPCLGHTASLVGDFVFIIGGRVDPLNILSSVWIIDIAKKEWMLSECIGSPFPPRHRHAAAVVGSNIYVFGGLNNDKIFSSLHVLDTENMQWKEVLVDGEQPSARHSHSMVGLGSKLFMFGGYDGDKALADLYSFDVQTCIWKKEKTKGISPNARFSHSMFVYKNFLGVIGGCPVRQHFQELALLDLRLRMWKHVTLNYIGKELLVRSTTNVVGDDLVMIGGGAACYAFGTKFSHPLSINLLPLISSEEKVIPIKIGEKNANGPCNSITGEKKNVNIHGPQIKHTETSTQLSDSSLEAEKDQLDITYWVVQLERKYAKLGKDILKNFGWLDLGRKVYSTEDGLNICFPVTQHFCSIFLNEQHQYEDALEGQNVTCDSKPFIGQGIVLNEISCSTAFNILKECHATKLADEIVAVRQTPKSPLQVLNEAVTSLIESKGLSEKLLEQLPTRWERLGDIVILPVTSFKDPIWDSLGKELWLIVARSLNARRLARQGRVAPTGTRDSTLEILVGDNGWVDHRENGIIYSFDATKCMFSWGNLSEKLRMGNLDCNGEVVVDLFAGIGYFVLPFLVRAKAKLVYACEWNPHAVEALKHNLDGNSASDRCVVIEGDNQFTAPKGVADRVCLGLLPTSENSWVTAVRALRSEGGMLHVHGNVKDSEEDIWRQYVWKSIKEIAQSEGHSWEVSIEHIERVKWYAPHIRHLVADVRCRMQILR